MTNEELRKEVNASEIQQRVDDYWRGNFALAGNGVALEAHMNKFTTDTIAKAESLSCQEAAEKYMEVIKFVAQTRASQFEMDPNGFRAELGIAPVAQVPNQTQAHVHGGGQLKGLAATAAHTLVRATVWETVRSVFRLFR